MQLCHIVFRFDILLYVFGDRLQQKADQRQPFIKFRAGSSVAYFLRIRAVQDTLNLIIRFIFIIQIIVNREFFGRLFVLQVLTDEIFIHGVALFFVELDHRGKVFPTSRRHKLNAVDSIFDAVEVIFLDLQIGRNGGMDTFFISVLFPHAVIRFHHDFLHTVQSYDIEFSHGFIVFRRISGGGDNPSFGDLVFAESLILEELEHRRRQRLGHTVDLIQEENTFRKTGLLHKLIHRGDNFTHRIFRDHIFPAFVSPRFDLRQTDSALTGVMSHRIRDETDTQFLRNLFHDRCLSDARIPDQQDRSLPDPADAILTEFILHQIRCDRTLYFVFCFFYIHISTSCMISLVSRTSFMAQPGTSYSNSSSSTNTNAVS